MYVGIAGALLVFTGVWHATEWMMDGRRRDTWALVPFGIVYLVLGCLLVTATGGSLTMIVALLAAAYGGAVAFSRRYTLKVRRWVTWSFILIDVVVVACLALALLA